MNLHEYQAKQLFQEYGITVARHEVVEGVDEAVEAVKSIGGDRWVVKAMIHAGGRGKAGGVVICSTPDEVRRAAESLLGKRLVTYQTDKHGQPVHRLLIEEVQSIKKELYLGAAVDRSSQRITFICSTEGGVEIEKIALESPEKLYQSRLYPILGIMPYQGRELAFSLGLEGKQIKQFVKIIDALSRLFIDKDLALIEVNPLVITGDDDLLCLDAKINVDGNAAFRQTELWKMRDLSQEDERELIADQHQLNYVALEGNIGCMVNGAGLAMATMDIIKLHGGSPANFLDVGGGATAERVTEAFKLILSDKKVEAILINIFGGIVRCDLIAEGIVKAASQIQLTVPLVVRLQGNRADVGAKILANSGLNITTSPDLAEVASQVVSIVQGAK